MTTTPTRKVTPTGVLLLSADAPREEWLAIRREGVTATDLPAILGLSKYKTAIDVWLEKVRPGDNDFDPRIGSGEAAFWGIKLEDTVARAWAEDKGFAVRRVGIIAHDANPWMRASLDRLVTGCPDGRCALEVKTRSGYVGEEWDRGVPEDVAAQVRWQLIVSGLDHIHVIALIGGQRLVHHVLHLKDISWNPLVEPASRIMASIRTGEAPVMPETTWTDDYLEQLHPEREGEVEVLTDVWLVAADYEEITAKIKALEERKAELKTSLIGYLGEHDTATYNGEPVYSYKASTTRRLDSKKLAELYPDAAGDDRVHSVTTTRTLRITTRKGN